MLTQEEITSLSAPYGDCPPSQGNLMTPGTHPLPNPETFIVPKDFTPPRLAPLPGPGHPCTLTTNLTCFAKSLELPVRKSEKAVCQGKRQC